MLWAQVLSFDYCKYSLRCFLRLCQFAFSPAREILNYYCMYWALNVMVSLMQTFQIYLLCFQVSFEKIENLTKNGELTSIESKATWTSDAKKSRKIVQNLKKNAFFFEFLFLHDFCLRIFVCAQSWWKMCLSLSSWYNQTNFSMETVLLPRL